MLRKIKKFLSLPWSSKGLWLEAVFWLAVARYRIARMPFREWAGKLGEHMADVPTIELKPQQREQVKLISWAVQSAAMHVPWQAVCLPQAMAAKIMLRRRSIPSVLYLGMRKGDTNPYHAHAWVQAGGEAITGGQSPGFTVVSFFV